jgi:hypothetical protein
MGLALRIDALNTQQYDRGTSMPSSREMRVKVVVQRYASTRIIPCSVRNLNVLGSIHSDLPDMNRVKTLFA